MFNEYLGSALVVFVRYLILISNTNKLNIFIHLMRGAAYLKPFVQRIFKQKKKQKRIACDINERSAEREPETT